MLDKMQLEVYFIDLDGTLIDDRWRQKYIDYHKKGDPKAKYRAYHKQAKNDAICNKDVKMLISNLQFNKVPYYFLTSRPEKYRQDTINKLNELIGHSLTRGKGDPGKNLIMRHYEINPLPTPEWKWRQIQDILQSEEYADYNIKPIIVDNDIDNVKYAIDNGAHGILISHWESSAHELNYKEMSILPKGVSSKGMDIFTPLMRIYSERNEAYGDNYLKFGSWAKELIGDQYKLENYTHTPKDWNRLALLFHMMNKLSRYCKSFSGGGHKDSLEDLIIYATMLREVDES